MSCKLETCQNGFIDLTNNFAEIVNSWNVVSKNYQIIFDNVQELFDLLDHIHKCHLHQYNHYPDYFPTENGMRGGCGEVNPLDRLVREISGQVDLDDNKEVYGTTFIFKDSDPDVPRQIKETQTQCEIEFGRMKDIFKSFSKYFDVFKIRQRCFPTANTNPIQKLLIQGILKENPDNPNSKYYNKNLGNGRDDGKQSPCSNLVYGVNFIIDPEDPDKPQELIEFEKELDIPENIKRMKYSDYVSKCTEKKKQEKLDSASSKTQLTEEEKKDAESCGYVCTRLVGEWVNQVDIDHNGLIYGNDFAISNSEPKKCRCLKEIEQDIQWQPPADLPYISWEEFCATFPDNNPDDRYKK